MRPQSPKGALPVLALSLFASSGCGLDSAQRIVPVGDTLVPITPSSATDLHFAAALPALGRMPVPSPYGEAFCTVTHIGGGVAVTAGHCLSDHPTMFPECEGRFISWGVPVGQSGTSAMCGIEILDAEDTADGDFAILEIGDPPRASIPLDLRPFAASERLMVYSFPGGAPRHSEKYCVLKALSPTFVEHGCATEKGSSGAALLSQAVAVMGIHSGSTDSLKQNMATRFVADDGLTLAGRAITRACEGRPCQLRR